MNTYLFFDDFMIDSMRGWRKRHFKAERCGSFRVDRINGGHSVVRKDGKYHLFYTTMQDASKDWNRQAHYALSDDGVNYTSVGPVAGMPVPGGFYVNEDLHTSNPDERYKTVIMQVEAGADHSAKGCVATSGDLLNWRVNPGYQVTGHQSDTTNNVFYNPVLKKYQVIYRGAFIDRRISTRLSDDLRTWSEPMLIMSPTPFDEPLTQYYGMVVYPFDGILLGALQLYHTDADDFRSTKMIGKTDAALVYSYNGINWSRVSNGFMIERPLYPAYGSGGIYPMNLVESPDGRDWIIGAGGVINDHGCGFAPAYPDWPLPPATPPGGNAAVCFHRIRKQGFTALESYGYASTLRFKKVQLLGGTLTFNGISTFGFVKFQLKDEDYRVIEGFSFADSVPYTGDSVAFAPQFKQRRLEELKGRSVHLELECRTATLFAMEGDFRPHHGKQPQASLGAPTPVES